MAIEKRLMATENAECFQTKGINAKLSFKQDQFTPKTT